MKKNLATWEYDFSTEHVSDQKMADLLETIGYSKTTVEMAVMGYIPGHPSRLRADPLDSEPEERAEVYVDLAENWWDIKGRVAQEINKTVDDYCDRHGISLIERTLSRATAFFYRGSFCHTLGLEIQRYLTSEDAEGDAIKLMEEK